MHLLTPNHVQLISACYPPSSALASAGPEYKPNAQELSRLTYYASNRPGKLGKLGNELQKRATTESRRAQYSANNVKSKSSLMLTLAIFKALVVECRHDIPLLSAALMQSLALAFGSLPSDLEVCARAASVFTAWVTYTDGRLIGVDPALTKDYMFILKHLAGLCIAKARGDDTEERNKKRLIGLVALSNVVNSDALNNSPSKEFKAQIEIITPAIVQTIMETKIDTLEDEAENLEHNPMSVSPYLSEFRSRPTVERRAASIHVHMDGDKGPSQSELANASLRALSSLLSQANNIQIRHVLHATFNSLEKGGWWSDPEHCCWLARKSVDWTQFQYRYAVPSRLVERLLDARDPPTPLPEHKTLALMIRTVFTSPTPVVNLSTSDIMSSLVTSIVRRIAMNPKDTLVPDLVDCVSALGTHIYYADQIHDLASELISRMVNVEVNGIPEADDREDECRAEALRYLLIGLIGLMNAHGKPNPSLCRLDEEEVVEPSKFGSTPASIPDADTVSKASAKSDALSTALRRTKIPPDVWQDTLTLLCNSSSQVREQYAQALVTFLRHELAASDRSHHQYEATDATITPNTRRNRLSLRSPTRRRPSVSGDADITRFLNALHASVYVLATSSALSTLAVPLSQSGGPNGDYPVANINIIPSTPIGESKTTLAESEGTVRASSSRRQSIHIPSRSRKMSMARRLLRAVNEPVPPLPSAPHQCACDGDYAHILRILTVTYEHLPYHAVMEGVPMLVALDNSLLRQETSLRSSDEGHRRLKMVREVIARTWKVIGRVWNCGPLVQLAEESLTGKPTLLPSLRHLSSSPPQSHEHTPSFEASGYCLEPPTVDRGTAITLLASNEGVQRATGLDQSKLLQALGAEWTPEKALDNSVERRPNDSVGSADGVNPLLKISPALMQIENLSLQSLARSNRSVGVSDLREALEGRSGMSSPNLAMRAPSISSFSRTAQSVISGESTATNSRSMLSPRPKKRQINAQNGNEVRDVLNKLGIGGGGGRSGGGEKNINSLLKASFPTFKNETQSPMFVPPYKS